MTPQLRLLASAGLFIGSFAVTSAASPATPTVMPIADQGPCWEGTIGTETAHDFDDPEGGACYQYAPNGYHRASLVGYCHTYHYDGDPGGSGCEAQ